MDEKLQKIVTLAKRGEGGEKETAIALVMKHDLWYQPTAEEWEKIRKEGGDLDEEELKRRARAAMMAHGLEDVELQRRLKGA